MPRRPTSHPQPWRVGSRRARPDRGRLARRGVGAGTCDYICATCLTSSRASSMRRCQMPLVHIGWEARQLCEPDSYLSAPVQEALLQRFGGHAFASEQCQPHASALRLSTRFSNIREHSSTTFAPELVRHVCAQERKRAYTGE